MGKVVKDIRCNACNCVHHADDYKCTAGHIEIGNTSACSCQDTLCATFELDNSKKHCGC